METVIFSLRYRTYPRVISEETWYSGEHTDFELDRVIHLFLIYIFLVGPFGARE